MTDKNQTTELGVAILAGGYGTRLDPVLAGLPKALAPIGGKPLLEYQLELLKGLGNVKTHFFVHHLADSIQTFVASGDKWNIKATYHRESIPRGTAGAILDSLDHLPETFFVFYGDTLMSIDLQKMLKFHREMDADATLLVHPNDHPFDSDIIELDATQAITTFHKPPHPSDRYLPNLVNAALYIVQKSSLTRHRNFEGKLDFARDLFPAMLSERQKVFGYRSREYIKDMGTPERLKQGEKDLLTGKVERLIGTIAAPAVFLDRDGTIIEERCHLRFPEQVELIRGSAIALKRLNKVGLLSVVVTNQPVLARGECSFETLQQIHNRLESKLGEENAYLDGIYFCPHHPDSGFPGEVAELKKVCECRKPMPGLIQQAVKELNIDAKRSWMIGDSTSDVAAGKMAGCLTALVRTGLGGKDYKYPVRPDFIFYDLLDAVNYICDGYGIQSKHAANFVSEHVNCEAIFLAGPSRSGKTTWASHLRLAFKYLGRDAHILSTDSWLLDEAQRGDNVTERHNISELSDTINRLLNAPTPIEIKLPWYDRSIRKTIAINPPTLRFNPGDVLIVEGVIAHPSILKLSQRQVSVAISFDEDTHRMRFEKEYRFRGLSDQQIRQLWERRELPELRYLATLLNEIDQHLPSY